MSSIAFTYHQDPGHGWLEVPMSTVRYLGIGPKVSGYSYRSGDTAYLEEDCDAGLLMQACKAQGIEVKLIEAHDDRDSFIRRLPRFAPL